MGGMKKNRRAENDLEILYAGRRSRGRDLHTDYEQRNPISPIPNIATSPFLTLLKSGHYRSVLTSLNRYLCSPSSTTSPFWLWTTEAIATTPVVF